MWSKMLQITHAPYSDCQKKDKKKRRYEAILKNNSSLRVDFVMATHFLMF